MYRVLLLFALLISMSSCATVFKGSGNHYVVISKEEMNFTLFNKRGREVISTGMACGAAYGDKEREGDKKTPEGHFYVSEICDASEWTHDFGDGKGEIEGAYGSHFVRLSTPPHTGIGIHGTHDEASIGTHASEGCIRLHNKMIRKFARYAYIGMPVTIGEDRVEAVE